MNTGIDVEQVIHSRYSSAAQEREEALCCPVEYDPRLLEVIPNEILWGRNHQARREALARDSGNRVQITDGQSVQRKTRSMPRTKTGGNLSRLNKPMSIAPDMTLGPYSIVSKIGEGGMGEVWRARDPKLGRDVAIKVLPAAFSEDKSRLARFEQEAQAAGALNHPFW